MKAAVLGALVVVVSAAPLGAQEQAIPPVAVAKAKDSKLTLKQLQSVGIFLTGNDPVLARLAEDAVAIQLANVGLVVINRAQMEKVANDHAARVKPEKPEGALGAVDLVRLARGHGVVSGTLLVALGEQRSVLVRAASFEVITLDNDSTVFRVLFDFEKGRSLPEVARAFAEAFNSARR